MKCSQTMEDKIQELNLLQEYVREQLLSKGISLDFSFESLKHLDTLFDEEYRHGELINPTSAFAQKEGMILAGIAGYLANVLVKNSNDSKVLIDSDDDNWYINFKVESTNGWIGHPGQRVVKRKVEGRESDLYHYAIAMTKYFNQAQEEKPKEPTFIQELYVTDDSEGSPKKPWWKIW